MQNLQNSSALLRHITTVNDFTRWLRTDGERLIASADMLGGMKWSDRARSLVKAARLGQDLVTRLHAIDALNKLLHLEFADAFATVEGQCFACVHPDDPRADAARLCAEALERGLYALNALRKVGYRQVGGRL